MSGGCEGFKGDGGLGSSCRRIKSLKDSNSYCWDLRRVVRKTSKCGLSLVLEGEILSGVRVIFLWSFWKV